MPNLNDPKWVAAIQNNKDMGKATLATRLLLTRLRQEVKANPGSLREKARELFEFFEKNAFAQKDVALL
ncbi:MAG: hypothetical protein MRY74_09160 [Neomegalonema sp.]|nr:hypothetical protein [Neomegalonema sp.]